MTNKTKNIIHFTSITLGSTILLWGSLILFQFEVPNLESQEPTKILPMIIYVLNGFIPSITGLFLYIKQGNKSRLKSLLPQKNNLKDIIILIIVFIVIFTTQTLFYNLFIGNFNYNIILIQLGQLLPLIILGPLSEEIGWRGYLQDQFPKTKPIKTSIIIGLIWALWHLPLFFIFGTTQQINQMSFITFTILIIFVSYIMTYFYNRNNGSIFIGVFIHYLYTVILTFYILGTEYSLLGNVISIIPIAIFALIFFSSTNNDLALN